MFNVHTYSINRNTTTQTLGIIHLTFDVAIDIRINRVIFQPFLVRKITSSFFGRPTFYTVVGQCQVSGDLYETMGTL